MGSQGSGGTLNPVYSAEEMLKASVSNEGRMNVLLWYRLVGAYVGLLPGFAPEVSGCAWYGGDSPHLAVGPSPCWTTCGVPALVPLLVHCSGRRPVERWLLRSCKPWAGSEELRAPVAGAGRGLASQM